MDPEARKILYELLFFLSLAGFSEAWRFYLKRRTPESERTASDLAALHYWFVCSLVLCWYSSSVSLVLYNKWWVSHTPVHATIFFSTLHMLLKGLLSLGFLACGKQLPRVSLRVALMATVVGVCTGMDITASNLSFSYVTASFYTMLKTSSILFILAFALCARIEACSLHLFAASFLICGGMCLASYGEAEFDGRGVALIVSSEVFAAFRWLVTQVLLHDGTLDAMSLVFLMSPASTLSVLPLALAREGDEIRKLDDVGRAAEFALLALLPGILAFVLVLVEVQLVKETKALSLSVFGNLKSIVTIVFSIIVFGDRTTLLQWCGVAVALSGIFVFSGHKRRGAEGRERLLLPSEALAVANENDDHTYDEHRFTEDAAKPKLRPDIFR